MKRVAPTRTHPYPLCGGRKSCTRPLRRYQGAVLAAPSGTYARITSPHEPTCMQGKNSWARPGYRVQVSPVNEDNVSVPPTVPSAENTLTAPPETYSTPCRPLTRVERITVEKTSTSRQSNAKQCDTTSGEQHNHPVVVSADPAHPSRKRCTYPHAPLADANLTGSDLKALILAGNGTIVSAISARYAAAEADQDTDSEPGIDNGLSFGAESMSSASASPKRSASAASRVSPSGWARWVARLSASRSPGALRHAQLGTRS